MNQARRIKIENRGRKPNPVADLSEDISNIQPSDRLSDRGREIFFEIRDDLANLGLARPSDKVWIESMAYYQCKWEMVGDRIGEEFSLPGRDGGIVKNPMHTMEKDYFDLMTKAADKLGMSISGRSRLKLPTVKKSDSLKNPMNL